MALEHLFGSTTRVRLLMQFLKHPEKKFFVRELTRSTEGHIHAIRRELSNLEALGIVRVIVSEEPNNPWGDTSPSDKKKKYYILSPDCLFFDDLKSLFSKDAVVRERVFLDELKMLGGIDYLLMTGIFTGDTVAVTDLLIVGSVSKEKIAKLTENFERSFEKEVRYSLMTTKEYTYRRSVVDRFLYDIIDRKHIVLVDKISEPEKNYRLNTSRA